MAEAPPLSLRDRIRQLEQAAHSPLTDGPSNRHTTTLASKGPTSSPRLHNATAVHSLAVQQVAHADDPLQQSVDAPTLPPAASPSTRTSGRSAPPPPTPPRPVWVSSKARVTPTATLSPDMHPVAEAGRVDRDHATAGAGPSQATLAGSDVAPGGEQSSTQASLQSDSRPASASGSIPPTTRSKPALPARPPAATVPSPILSDPPRPRSVSACSDVLDQVSPSSTSTSAAPALPPRPAWARKPSPASSPGSLPAGGSRVSAPAPTSHLERRDSDLRGTASSAAGSTGGHPLAPFPAAGALSGSSSSPALPPRPPRGTPSPAPQKTDTKSSAVVAANARRRYDRLFSQCVEAAAAAAPARPSPGSEERLDGAVIGELWRRNRLDDALLRRIWNEVASPEQQKRSSLDRDEFARGMGMIDAELRRRQR
ncbi:hypothetical protein RHOSPDRAFT_31980 [Rhodotorula sp. JG-1b]|nr:hypothetical protein RHOSPDRAFT_31980 [Rhodotorula sp. JG-1b]